MMRGYLRGIPVWSLWQYRTIEKHEANPAVRGGGGQEPVRYGVRVYIPPMDGLWSQARTAFRIIGVPMEVVWNRDAAEYELDGEATGRIGLRLPFVERGAGPEVVNLRLKKVSTGEVVLAKTFAAGKGKPGKRRAVEGFATELERRIREGGARRVIETTAVVTGVRFTSQPGSAELEVDGVYFGVTPTAELTRLKPGTHVIVVKKSGYQRWERTVELAAGETRLVNAELEKAAGGTSRISGLD